jgi:polar amino acid transport system ATP-binding protein
MAEPYLITIEKLTKSFSGRHVLFDIDLSVAEGEAVVLLGRSGAGKTTLLRCINLLETPTSGTISLNGSRIFGNGADLKPDQLVKLRRGLGMVFQNFGLFPHLTSLENITMPLIKGMKLTPNEAIERALATLSDVGLSERAFDLPSTLSGGQQQRVAIARALALQPTALLFDEPTSALDLESTADLLAVLQKLKSKKMTMIVVTHDVDFAMSLAERIAFMKNGSIIASGTPEELVYTSRHEDVNTFFRSYRPDRVRSVAAGFSEATETFESSRTS